MDWEGERRGGVGWLTRLRSVAEPMEGLDVSFAGMVDGLFVFGDCGADGWILFFRWWNCAEEQIIEGEKGGDK